MKRRIRIHVRHFRIQNTVWQRVLRIRDVYPGSRIRIFSSRIPGPGLKRHWNPESGSATLMTDTNLGDFSNGTFSRCWTKLFIPVLFYLKSEVWKVEARVSPWVPLVWCHWSACPGYNSPIQQQQLLLAQEMHSDLFPGIEYLPTLPPHRNTSTEHISEIQKYTYLSSNGSKQF